MSRFRRRLMGLAQLREAKRNDFVRVEYIENTSTAYIDTLYVPNANTEIEFDFQYNETLDGNKYIGSISKAVDDRFRRWHLLAANTQIGLWRNSQNQTSTIDFDLNKHIYRLGGNYTEIDGIRTEATAYNYISVNHFGLFARIGNPTIVEATNEYYSTPSLGKMTYCKIWESGTLVRDFIPMYQISTDTYGLLDRVEKKFYTSPNGVKFTGGARVVEDANGNLYYIKNYISFAGSGKSLVSIGIKPNETDYYETKWYFAGSGRSNFMGARTKSNNNDYQCYGYSKALHITYDTGNICNYSVTYTNKAYIFKTYFNKKTNQMYAAIYDANKNILAQNKVAKRSGTASVDFFIGKQNGLNNYYPPVNSRMYYFKYWRNHNLVRDMIPVQSVETGEYGFFDKVNLKIYYSSGSVDFTGA